MEPQPPETIEVFYSYAHAPEDEKLRDELVKHLAILRRQGVITNWYDRGITPGKEWDDDIKQHLNSATVILLLISPDFMDSDYCNDVEVTRAMERHDAGEACVIPVFLRPVNWKGAPFGKLQGLPTDAKPVTSWSNRDEAFVIVSEGIQRAVEALTASYHAKVPSAGRPRAFTYIPRPPIVGFVSRRDEQGRDIVGRLTEELAPHSDKLITLSGPGGVGKTTLAAETARALSKLFEGRIVWSSAEARADYALYTLLDDIVTQLGREDLRTLAPDLKEAQVSALVAEPQVLIILDNYETITRAARESIERWFRQAQCPALFTSRHKISSTLNIAIAAMSREEAQEYLEKIVGQTQDTKIFSDEVRQSIYETADANPFVMQWIVAQIDEAQEPRAVLEELAQGEGDAAERVFDRSFNLPQLGDDGRATLLALSLFTPSASRVALASVAGFGDDQNRLNEAVKNLRALWLIKGLEQNRRFTIEGLTRSLASSRLSKDERAAEFRQSFIAYFRGYAKAHQSPSPEDYDALESEKDNLLTALDAAFASGDWESVLITTHVLVNPVEGVMSVRGYWDEAIRYGEQAVAAAKSANNEWAIAQYAGNAATIRMNRGEYEEARIVFEKAVDAFKKLKSDVNVAAGLHQLARLAQDQGKLDEARRLYNESLEIGKKLGNQRGIAVTLHQLAWLAEGQGEVDEARRLYDESLEIEKKLGNQLGIARTLHNLAVIAHDQGELDEARRLYDESLEIRKKLGDQSGIADTLHNLGILAAGEGNNAEAARLYGEALSIFERLKSPNAEIARASLKRVTNE